MARKQRIRRRRARGPEIPPRPTLGCLHDEPTLASSTYAELELVGRHMSRPGKFPSRMLVRSAIREKRNESCNCATLFSPLISAFPGTGQRPRSRCVAPGPPRPRDPSASPDSRSAHRDPRPSAKFWGTLPTPSREKGSALLDLGIRMK